VKPTRRILSASEIHKNMAGRKSALERTIRGLERRKKLTSEEQITLERLRRQFGQM
tara:strand:- start:301 stop:468 length:168 start_codon:yes stop_codon:yes gene_type:complete